MSECQECDRLDRAFSKSIKENAEQLMLLRKLSKALEVAESALKEINNDLGYFHHAAKEYLKADKEYQSIVKVGTPIRVATTKLKEALEQINRIKKGEL